MQSPPPFPKAVRFGMFEADLVAGELRKRRRKVELQDQPFHVLALLLRRPKELVTREELRQALWPADTFIEFDESLNKAVQKLRQALGDSADNPRFIETLPRKGYRFIAPVTVPEELPPPPVPRHRSLTILVAVGLAIIAAAVVTWHAGNEQSVPQSVPEPVLLTGHLGTKSEPSFSPDGDSVAFTWDGPKQDNSDTYVTQIGASEPVRLTSDPAVEQAPAWSPDGRSIAFLRRPYDKRSGLFLIPAIGGTAVKISELGPGTRFQQGWAHPSWHPGGRWIAVSDTSSEREPVALFLLSIETGEKRRITSPPQNTIGDVYPAFSPNGRVLVFVRTFAGFRRDLHVLELSDDLRPVGDPKRITFAKPYNHYPAWSADGRSIVYASGESPHHPSLWRMTLKTPLGPAASLRQLPLLDAAWPAISRQGRLVYARRVWDFDIWRLELDVSGRRERLPSNSTRLEHTPQYSPDGKRIAFASDRSGSHEVWVCGGDGSSLVKLTSFGGPYLAQPVWSPDGRRLAFAVRLGAEDEICLVGSEGGKPEHLIRGSGPTWSRDGRWIYFGSKRSGTPQVWKLPVGGGSPVQVTKAGGESGQESVDRRFFYYTLNGAVWRALADGGEETRLIPSCYGFLEVVERGIYFTSASQQAAIMFFDFKTGKTKTIAEYGEGGSNPVSDAVGWGLSVSPDRRSLLFSKREDRGVDLMLVENFR
jgi:Tol biopolymer transport system component/DNA-binding winged helix-turn-helix (wHTH) protein